MSDRRSRSSRERRDSDTIRFVVRPNRSLPATGIVGLFVASAAIVLTVGVGFTLAGAWMVLLFAGLEVVVIGALCAWLYRHLDDAEQVVIDAERVRLIRRIGGRESHDDFPRYWARVALDRSQDEHRPSRLQIGSHGRFVSLAEYINEGDRLVLAEQLRKVLQP